MKPTNFNRITRLLGGLCVAVLIVGCSTDDAETARVHELVAAEKEYFINAEGGEALIPLYSNGKVTVEQLGGEVDWAEISHNSFQGDDKITVTFAENPSFPRMVRLRFVLDGGVRADTVCVKQYGVVPVLACPAPYKSIRGSVETLTQFEIDTNIPLEQLAVKTSYVGAADGWVRSVQPEQGVLVVDAKPNPGEEVCKAVVGLNYVDGWGTSLSMNLYITQADKNDEFGREITFAEARAMATEQGAVIGEDLIIEGVVVSDSQSKNMEANPSVSFDKVDVSVNDRTAYLESLDGRYGFRLFFDNAQSNVLTRGTRLSLSLKGTQLIREQNPERYTITSVIGENMVESAAGEAIPEKVRKISELTDDDVYTYVSLQNTEFLFKEGSYANIYEGYALLSSINSSQTNTNRMDGWASLLIDNEGGSIYAPVNMLCLWRRSGMGVPQGVGPTHGVIVHNQLPRYGNVGRYQVRVLDEAGFAMEWNGESAYHTYAKWDGALNYSFGTYAKYNPRYAYKKLDSITPSDDISAEKSTPNAELFCENKVTTVVPEAWPIAGEPTYNNPEPVANGTSTTCKGYALRVGVKGWYQWEDNQVVGYNGVRAEFSTRDLSGTRMLVGFSFSAGALTAATSKTFPAHWCLEYSVDGGTTYTLCRNAVTGADFVHLRSLPWWDAIVGGSRFTTCSSAGMSATDHAFFLPAEVFGQEKVCVRIRPYDKVMTVLPLVWNGDPETAEVSASTVYDNRMRFGIITMRYM